MSIQSQETERYCIAGALRHPEVLSTVRFVVNENDFKLGTNRVLYSTLVDCLQKGEELSSFRVAEKLKNAGVRLTDIEVPVVDYLDDIRSISITERGALEAFQELKKIAIRREIYAAGQALCAAQTKNGNDTVDQILETADKLYAGKLSVFAASSDAMFEDIFGDLEAVIEERGNNPIKDFGAKGPFERTNKVYGSLLRRGNINLVAARQGQGKTQLGQFFMMHVMKNYDIPILHLDMGEMSKFELQVRATSLLTGGKISPDMLETGEWRQNPESERMVRAVWPDVKKMIEMYYYHDVSDLTPDQIISYMKRFYLSKVKHRNKRLEDGLEMVTFYDYLKAFEKGAGGQARYNQEYQAMGYFVQNVKTAIQKVIPAALWTSLQVNRIGISGNKKMEDIDDTENVFGLSDRIIQQATHAWLLRRMTLEELVAHPNCGNYLWIPRKHRHLGPERKTAMHPVKMPDGSLRDNCVFLEGESFVWKEVGDLASLKDQIAVATPEDEDEDAEENHKPRKRRSKENVSI